MSLLKKFFGKADDSQPVATTGVEERKVEIIDEVASNAGKIKLNFKKLPKKVVEAMADETTGQEIDRTNDEEDKRRRDGQRGGLSGAFNDAALAARRAALEAEQERQRRRDIEQLARPMAAPPRPRPPSPGP